MSSQAPEERAPVRRIDRILAVMALSITLLAIGCFVAIMIGTATGMTQDDFSTGVWPVVTFIPLFGLPIGFALILALLIMTFVRQGRASRKR